MNIYWKFLMNYWLFLIISIFLLSPIYIFLVKWYEHSSFDEVVKKQIETNSIYWTALNQNNFSYKLSLIKEKKPNIVLLWSSRVMQFREEFFNDTFINAWWGMNYMSEGVMFYNEMLKFHKPEYLILWLDFWWFNDNYIDPESFSYHNNSWKELTFKKLSKPIMFLINDKISFDLFFNVLKWNYKNNITNFNNIWIQALDSSTWFRKDWSYFYSKYIFDLEKNIDIKFNKTLFSINNNLSRFKYWNELSKKWLDRLKKIIELSNINNIKLILFIPPISPLIYDELNKNKENYSYLNIFFEDIKKLEIENYNFHDPYILNWNNCEYIDWFHGWDVVYQRILLNMSNNNDFLNKIINIDKVKVSIKSNSGRILSVLDKTNYLINKESDFLELWCNKSLLY